MRHFHRPEVRRLCRLLWYAAWLAIGALLLMPVGIGAPSGSDLVVHAGLFGGMALGAVTFCQEPRRLALLAATTFALGVVLEGAQGLLPWRSFELRDMVADGLGALAGYGAALLVLRLLIRPADPALRARARA